MSTTYVCLSKPWVYKTGSSCAHVNSPSWVIYHSKYPILSFSRFAVIDTLNQRRTQSDASNAPCSRILSLVEVVEHLVECLTCSSTYICIPHIICEAVQWDFVALIAWHFNRLIEHVRVPHMCMHFSYLVTKIFYKPWIGIGFFR